MVDTILTELFKQGPMGALCAVLLYGYYKEKKKNEEMQKHLDEVQEQRIEDVKEHLTTFNQLQITLTTLTTEFRIKLDNILKKWE